MAQPSDEPVRDLVGEKPIAVPTLPAGTYAGWTGETVYQKGDRVLYDGVPYQSKWWNQGASPDAASSNLDSSPWVPLTVAQINEVETQLQATKTATKTK